MVWMCPRHWSRMASGRGSVKSVGGWWSSRRARREMSGMGGEWGPKVESM